MWGVEQFEEAKICFINNYKINTRAKPETILVQNTIFVSTVKKIIFKKLSRVAVSCPI